MRDFHQAKAMAKSLRAALQARSTTVTHSESLELIAQAFDCENWNVLAAKIATAEQADAHRAEPDATGNGVGFTTTIPIVRIFDVDKAKDFYLRQLGFTLDWEHRFGPTFPLYAQVSRSGIVLHLSEHGGDATPGSNTLVNTNGLVQFHRELSSRGFTAAIEEAPGNRMVLQIWDPFGNRLRFSETNAGTVDRRAEGYTEPASV